MRLQNNTLSAIRARYIRDLSGNHGPAEARAIFHAVVRERLGWEDARVLLDDHERLSESELLDLWRPLQQLRAGIPLQYVIGRAYFLGLPIKVDARVLIPRPETEELVERILKSGIRPGRVVDVCTGSGCIALALKAHWSTAEVIATDISSGALEVARANAHDLRLEVTFMEHDARTGELPGADLIVSNPPYVPRSEEATLEPHVRDQEPHLALFVEDDDPLLFYRSIGTAARKALRPDGELWFEAHRDHAARVADLLRSIGFQDVTWEHDLSGQPRFVRAR